MKKLFFVCAVVALLAAGCQKSGNVTQEAGKNAAATEFHETNVATDSLPAITKEVLVFKTFPPAGSTTNLFVHDAAGDKPFLPKDYYYVPPASRGDVKLISLPYELLVQKGSSLSFFNTHEQRLTPLRGITVPASATVIALESMTSPDSMLIALIDKDQLSRTPHPSVLYKVNRKDTAAAQRIANPIPDNLAATSDRFPIASVIYDATNNRVLQLMLQENAGFTGVQSVNLDTGARAEFVLPEPSGVSVASHLTIYPRNNSKNTIGVVDIVAEKLTLVPLTVPEYKKTQGGAFMNYIYLGKGYLAGMEYMQDNSIKFTMLHEQQGEVYKPIHAATLPYAFLKQDIDGNLYMVLSYPESMQTRIVRYSISTNRFTGILTVPGASSSEEIEFLK